MRRSCSLQENGLCLSILKRRCPLGPLCLGFGQSSPLQGTPVPVSPWLSRQEVQRSSFGKQSVHRAGGVLRCRLPWSWGCIFAVLSLLNLLKLTVPLFNVKQVQKFSLWKTLVFWRALLKVRLTYCAAEVQKCLEVQFLRQQLTRNWSRGARQRLSVSHV